MRHHLIDEAFHEPQPSLKKVDPPSKGSPVIILSGPTASGKTLLSLELARTLGGEVISADSVQVYRGMDIGTAKVSLEERMEIPHHLIDICDLSTSFNVVQFYEHATQAIREVQSRGNVPIIVGGTGFYLNALLYGPPKGPPSNSEVREKLELDLEKFGPEPLYQRLAALDPEYAKSIHHRDKHKVMRSLEIMTLTGKRVSEFPRAFPLLVTPEFNFRCWFVYFPKEILYSRIEMRCDEMMAEGFIQEVKGLMEKGLKNNLSASQAIGYRQCLEFLSSPQKDEDWERFVWEFKKASRRYAKRQFTWFKREPLFKWVNLDLCGYQRAFDQIVQDFDQES